MTDERLIAAVLAKAGFLSPLGVERIRAGTLNRNFRVETRDGPLFAREYREGLSPGRIREELELLAWCGERGIPVATPLDVGGSRLMEVEDRLWSLFPWVDGTAIPRGQATRAQAEALGEMHGRVQSVLANHPASAGSSWARRWNKDESLRTVSSLIEIAKSRAAEPWMMAALELHRDLLEVATIQPFEHFSSLPVQLVHGDFHDQQVLFGPAGDVVLVADWELFQAAPRAWELLRSLDFSAVLDSPLMVDYLAGYRQHIQLSRAEAELAVEWWLQNRLIGAWTWHAFFREGNERVADLLPSTAAQMRQLATPGWRESVSERFVWLATG